MTPKNIYLLLLLCFLPGAEAQVYAQSTTTKQYHYLPQGTDLVKVRGKHRFNRALYGGNSGFRVEAGDLPQFALYMPGMAGNMQFELSVNGKTKRLEEVDSIHAAYRPGAMLYTFRDVLLGKGSVSFHVAALYQGEGILIKASTDRLPAGTKLFLVYGGASGKRFNRDGDIGADPESSFDLKPEGCTGNRYTIDRNIFTLAFSIKQQARELVGILPEDAGLSVLTFGQEHQPYLKAVLPLATAGEYYWLVANKATTKTSSYRQLPELFNGTESYRQQLTKRVQLRTPDSFLNTLGGILSVAADAIYEDPGYLHGAVAWRMRLNAWRGAYAADPLGWHDRAKSHFSSYALSQVTEPANGPVIADTALGMARQLEKMGTSMFSSGYISRNPNGDFRPHHYDMNLVFIDQLLNHFQWTGDTAYVRQMWPLVQRHLAWEKRNFDADNDGLYDAYACIWASDALQYNGGAVTHSSAYNYKANLIAARLAALLKEDASSYEAEAKKIHNAIRLALWLPRLGSYAEYRDNLGLCKVHPAAGLWTIYHALDSKVPDAFEAYQALQYVDRAIPHIPVVTGEGYKEGYLLSTTNWQPYTWSVNNVALAENLHMALAFWQGNDPGTAFSLWRTALKESMLLGTSPGNFEQLSAYDAARGELYRDFADPVGMAARSLVEGLFGIQPRALEDTLVIRPGYPKQWQQASLEIPDITFQFEQEQNKERYIVQPRFPRQMQLQLQLAVRAAGVKSITVNNAKATYHFEPSVNAPLLVIDAGAAVAYDVVVQWNDELLEKMTYKSEHHFGENFQLTTSKAVIRSVKDPQQLFSGVKLSGKHFEGSINKENGWGTAFLELEQGGLHWWQPLNISVVEAKRKDFVPGAIRKIRTVNMSALFNDKVTHIFRNQYNSPRWPYPTLQLPVQGIGNWCYPKVLPEIDDRGLRRAAVSNRLQLFGGLEFETPSDTTLKNIIYTSLWDNYPDSVTVPLKGKGICAALLLCGSTNPMQSQLENGSVYITYTDGSKSNLVLTNPDNWWPVEQDYIAGATAFPLRSKPPKRLHLKTGKLYEDFAPDSIYTSLKGFSNRMIEGGAATILYLPLDSGKMLQSLTLKTTANEVVIGLMGISIIEETTLVQGNRK